MFTGFQCPHPVTRKRRKRVHLPDSVGAGSYLLPLLAILFLAGCQSKVYLMPSPIGVSGGDDSFFQHSPGNINQNRLSTLYATNRVPNVLSGRNDGYTIFPTDDLYLGMVTHMAGNDDDNWEEFYAKSLDSERKDDIPIVLENVQQLLKLNEESPLEPVSPETRRTFARINEIISKSADKDITVYVHGANSSFYRATAQGAQYFHYTGHNSVVLTFSWPSAENILRYKVDVLHAGKTVPAFARLIEYLALHTVAKNINIIAYSAGAQVAAPGLVKLRNNLARLDASEIRKRCRIGEVYFAAPDIDARSFAHRYSRFRDIVERVTISSNMKDSVLLHAQRFTGKSRLGRPKADEIPPEERDILINSSLTDALDILDIAGSHSLSAGTSHSFWYSHPWVSNDLLLLMLLKLSPEERRLSRVLHESGMEVWHFPEDYEYRIGALLEKLRN